MKIAWRICVRDENKRKDIQMMPADYRTGRGFIASKDCLRVNSAPIRICDKAWSGYMSS